MLEIKIEHFLDYCKVSNFAVKSIQSLRVRLNEFNRFINKMPVNSIQGITYRHLKEFITRYKNPSIHIKKARIWSLRQFFHFLKLNGWIKTNIASNFPYPKIEKTIPHLFRHTAATLLNKVSDPEITRHVLGHMRSNSTRKYTHLNPDQYAVYMQIHPYMEMSWEVNP